VIKVENIVAGYGRLQVLRQVSIEVGAGELVTVVGANGAGKSTLLRTIQGLLQAQGGSVAFLGEDITRLTTEKIVARGLTLVPETRDLFPDLSVIDNLDLGAYVHRREAGAASKRADAMAKVFEIFPALKERSAARAAALSGGQQQMLAIGRALMTRPKALMLDEPSLGLAPMLVRQIFEAIDRLRKNGLAILLVEQNVRSALRLAERAYVLETGAIVASGPAADLLKNEAVMKAYLGRAKAPARPAETQAQ
jgi:branched-chain amino acid transport system ATP-binding protein